MLVWVHQLDLYEHLEVGQKGWPVWKAWQRTTDLLKAGTVSLKLRMKNQT